VTLVAWGTLRRGEVLGLNRKDIDLRAGTVRVERSLHEFYDGRLELGPTKNGDPARSTCRARSCRRSRTICAASSAPRATPPVPRRNEAPAAP
jgi:integrase